MGYGAAIRDLRIRAGMTQKKLADCVGVSRSAVYDWERELYKPTDASKIAALEAALGLASGYLYSLFYGNPPAAPVKPGESEAIPA
jgi:transcriptional regulator with XRE-family HTH domain